MSYCNVSSLILSEMIMITLYTDFNRFLRERNGLSDGRVVSMRNGIFDGRVVSVTKNEYCSAVCFL